MKPDEVRWEAVLRRDAAQDGVFFFGVVTTGVFCKPSCPSRRPRRENVRFFDTAEEAGRAGLRPCLRCRPTAAEELTTARIVRACREIERNPDRPIPLAALAAKAGLSRFHFQRRFKAFTGMSPREYAQACRLWTFKQRLRECEDVTSAIFEAGFSSSSRLYEKSEGVLGMRPAAYRRGGAGQAIGYTTVRTDIGLAAIARTPRGICSIQFGDTEAELEDSLKAEFPAAILERDDSGLAPAAAALAGYLSGRTLTLDLPLDIRATAFQCKVWAALQAIGRGETRTYSDVARAIGAPQSARAVARACATNPVAVAIPCHRVVGAGGRISGYRWGLERKRMLLEQESEGRSDPTARA